MFILSNKKNKKIKKSIDKKNWLAYNSNVQRIKNRYKKNKKKFKKSIDKKVKAAYNRSIKVKHQ